jgi:hypothetical protein
MQTGGDAMTFWEVLSVIGFGATVLGAWLTASSYYNGERTRALTRDLAALSDQRHRETQEMIHEMHRGSERMDERHTALLERMDVRTERMDERADERHREVIEAIRTLRA